VQQRVIGNRGVFQAAQRTPFTACEGSIPCCRSTPMHRRSPRHRRRPRSRPAWCCYPRSGRSNLLPWADPTRVTRWRRARPRGRPPSR
jgi:hypothetical protein